METEPITRQDLAVLRRKMDDMLQLWASAMTDVMVLENKIKQQPDYNKRIGDGNDY